MPSRTAVNAQSGVCTPAGGLMTGERPFAHMRTTFPGPRREAGGKERRGPGGGAVGSGAQLCPWGEGPRGGGGWGARSGRQDHKATALPPRRRPGAAVARLPDVALLLHPQVRPGRRHHHGRGPPLRHQDPGDALARQEYVSPGRRAEVAAPPAGRCPRRPSRGSRGFAGTGGHTAQPPFLHRTRRPRGPHSAVLCHNKSSLWFLKVAEGFVWLLWFLFRQPARVTQRKEA